MAKLFNDQMSSSEARTVLFTAVEGKSKEEIKEIKLGYSQVLPAIVK